MVIEVDMLDLDELKKVRELIVELSAIGTKVSMRDSTGIITLKFLNNIIFTFEEIEAEREELDALMFDEGEWFVLLVSKGNTLRKSNSNYVSVALPYSSTACG